MAKIFLSSTFEDLKDFRGAVIQSLKKFGHSVDSMEDFQAGNERPLSECRRRVRESDLYIGLLAWRYGYQPADKRWHGKSVTEIEYSTAIESDIECLWFLIDKHREWRPDFIDQGQQGEFLASLKRRIQENHVTDSFNGSPADLALQVGEAVAAWQGRRELCETLERQFSSAPTRFSILSDHGDGGRTITGVAARSLFKELSKRIDSKASQITVGIVGGPTTRQIINHISEIVAGMDGDSLGETSITLVALNMAGESSSYQNSANYQVTRLAEVLAATHLAAVIDWLPAEQDLYEKAVEQMDVLLCSCGDSDGFLLEWIRKRTKSLSGISQADMVGDFCLTPIDGQGNAVILPGLSNLTRELCPRPTFATLQDIRKEGRTIILPVIRHPRTYTADEVSLGMLTDKSRAVTAVLRAGIVDHCILQEGVAKALLVRTPPTTSKVHLPAKLCGFDLVERVGEDVLGTVFRTDSRRRVRVIDTAVSNVIPPSEVMDVQAEVIVSDGPCDADFDDTHVRRFPMWLDGRTRWVELLPGVRKPGNWASAAIRLARSHMPRVLGRKLRMLDMGCGSGVIGTFLALGSPSIDVTFSDIENAAVECARNNASLLEIQHQTRVGDLFEKFSSTDKFDLIVFGAPFYPHLQGVEHSVADFGGPSGCELAVRFVLAVKDFLTDGGLALTYIADFVGGANITEAALQAGLLCRSEVKYILYPFVPKHGYPVASEVLLKSQIERACSYKFEDQTWDGRRFLGFRMLYFMLSKPERHMPATGLTS